MPGKDGFEYVGYLRHAIRDARKRHRLIGGVEHRGRRPPGGRPQARPRQEGVVVGRLNDSAAVG
jgi:hypothetical protein